MSHIKYACAAIAALLAGQSASAATWTDSLQGTKLSPSLYVFATDPAFVRSSHSPFKAVPGASGLRLSRPASAANGGVFIYSRFTFGGPFRLTVDNTGWEFGLDDDAEAGLGVGIPGVPRGSDIFALNGIPGHANNFLPGVTELSQALLPDGVDRLTIAGDTGASRFQIVLFLLQEFGRTGIANAITFTNLSLGAAKIGTVPEGGTLALLAGGTGLLALARRRARHRQA